MALLANSTVRTVIQVVLTLVIIVLGYVLYETIAAPGREFEQQQELTEISRERMRHLRSALTAYQREYTGYPSTLDSLAQVIRTDSLFVNHGDEIFDVRSGGTLPPVDTLLHTARGPRFEYATARTEGGVWTYLLRNPVTGDSIGTVDTTRASGLRNVASWE